MERVVFETGHVREGTAQPDRRDEVYILGGHLEDKMEEKFVIVWTVDGETTSVPHSRRPS
jgi:hypothetical protein